MTLSRSYDADSFIQAAASRQDNTSERVNQGRVMKKSQQAQQEFSRVKPQPGKAADQ